MLPQRSEEIEPSKASKQSSKQSSKLKKEKSSSIIRSNNKNIIKSLSKDRIISPLSKVSNTKSINIIQFNDAECPGEQCYKPITNTKPKTLI